MTLRQCKHALAPIANPMTLETVACLVAVEVPSSSLVRLANHVQRNASN